MDDLLEGARYLSQLGLATRLPFLDWRLPAFTTPLLGLMWPSHRKTTWIYDVAAISAITETATDAAATTLQSVVKFRRRVTGFDDLPDDVLVEIMHAADLPTILALRRSSRKLSRVSRTYSVWSTAFRYLAATCPSRQLLELERPFSTYSSSELENIVSRQVRLEKNWTSLTPTPRQLREVKIGTPFTFMEFIPGGRWMIVGTCEDKGRLLYCDLDSDTAELRTLIEDDEKTGPGYPRVISICMNGDSERLEFDMALVYEREDKWPNARRPMVISTWRVSLDQSFTSLTTQNVHSFSLVTEDIEACSLRAGYLLRSHPRPLSTVHYEVYDLARCSEGSVMKAIVVPAMQDRPTVHDVKLRLLPGNRILAITHARFAIYEIGPFSVDSEIGLPSPPPTEPVWSHAYFKRGDGVLDVLQPIPAISPGQIWYSAPKPISITSYYLEAVRTLHIPVTSVLEATVDTIKFGEANESVYGKGAAIGPSRGLWWRCRRKKWEVALISWEPANELAVLRAFGGLPVNARACESSMVLSEVPYSPPEEPATTKFWFEERSGRAVFLALREEYTLLVVDYA